MNENRFLCNAAGKETTHDVRKGRALSEEEFNNEHRNFNSAVIGRVENIREQLEREGKLVELSGDQMEVVSFVRDAVNETLENRGCNTDAIQDATILFVDRPTLQGSYGEKSLAVSFPQYNLILCSASDDATSSQMSANLYHESMHVASYSRSAITDTQERYLTDPDSILERGGMRIYSRKKNNVSGTVKEEVYFDTLDEAIVERLTRKFVEKKMRSSELFQEDFEELSKLGTEFPTGAIYENGPEGKGHVGKPYQDEIDQLERIMRQVCDDPESEYDDIEQVFSRFTAALFSGNLLSLARMLEKTKGKGYFRRLAELTQKK